VRGFACHPCYHGRGALLPHLFTLASIAGLKGPRYVGRATLLGSPSRAVCFLCHFPSGCPDRGLPGALPCGVRTFLPPSRLAALRRDDHSSSSAITGGVKRPTRRLRTGRPDDVSLFGLAPCGVLPATRVTTGAVRSYRTFSPLPSYARRCLSACRRATEGKPRRPAHRSAKREGGRYIFCATVLQVALTGDYPAHCPLEFGLSSPRLHLSATAQPTSPILSRRNRPTLSGEPRHDAKHGR
jgi:hypothetical protein